MGKLFGTDGIRGEANQYPMDAQIAFSVGQAITYLLKTPNHRTRIIIGKDTRISGYMLESALESGITSMGGYPYLVGVLPTPGIAFVTQSMRADAGIVISASHNPYQDNGIKIFSGNGVKLSDDEEEKIEKLIEPIIESEKKELVDLECLKMKSRWVVRVYIDKAGGVTLDDCAEISHQLGDVLDIHDVPPGPYTLEVSSPGLDRPLVKDGDFVRYQGRLVKIRLREKIEGAKNFRGRLVGFLEEEGRKMVVLDVEGKIFRIPKEVLNKANLEYES